MEYTSNDNKGLLWGILQESNIFDGINNSEFDKIKHIFENTIYNINLNNSNKSLIDKNKITIEEMIGKINKERNTRESPKIQVVYKAEDLKQEKLSEFNTKLQKYQEDNGSLGKVTKPEEIVFTDNNEREDKPIGDEMDRLISERLATRERELEVMPVSNDAENWINNGRDSSPNTKKVSFQEEEDEPKNTSETTQVNNILNILKRKTQVTNPTDELTESIELLTTTSTTTTTNTEPYTLSRPTHDKYDETTILKEIDSLKKQQSQIINMCSKIITILQDKNIS